MLRVHKGTTIYKQKRKKVLSLSLSLSLYIYIIYIYIYIYIYLLLKLGEIRSINFISYKKFPKSTIRLIINLTQSFKIVKCLHRKIQNEI